jgi:hypothetical protein
MRPKRRSKRARKPDALRRESAQTLFLQQLAFAPENHAGLAKLLSGSDFQSIVNI